MVFLKIKDNKFDSCIDFIEVCGLDKTQIETLIKIDYFSEFGSSKKLLQIYNKYRDWSGKKTAKKDALPFEEFLIKMYSEKELVIRLDFNSKESLCNNNMIKSLIQKTVIIDHINKISFINDTIYTVKNCKVSYKQRKAAIKKLYKYAVNIPNELRFVLLKRNNKIIFPVTGQTIFHEGDVITIAGSEEHLKLLK